MKIIKPGRPQEGFSIEQTCTGNADGPIQITAATYPAAAARCTSLSRPERRRLARGIAPRRAYTAQQQAQVDRASPLPGGLRRDVMYRVVAVTADRFTLG